MSKLTVVAICLSIALFASNAESAADGCTRLLGPVSSTQNLTMPAKESTVNKDVSAYLRLIQYGLEKLSSTEREQLLHGIRISLALPVPTNPFEHMVSPLGVQLKTAVARKEMLGQVSRDWNSTKEQLRQILDVHVGRQEERQQSEENKKWIGGVIDGAWKILLNGEVRTSPVWQLIDGKWYVVVGAYDRVTYSQKIHVLEFDPNESDSSLALKVVGELDNRGDKKLNPTWQQINGRWYIAVGVKHGNLSIFQFDPAETDKRTALSIVGEVRVHSAVELDPIWQQINGDWYIAMSVSSTLYVLKFEVSQLDVAKSLRVIGRFEAQFQIHESPTWQQVGHRWYVSFATNEGRIYVLSFEHGNKGKTFVTVLLSKLLNKASLNLAGVYLTDGRIFSKPAWRQIDGEWFVAGSNDSKIYILKFHPDTKSRTNAFEAVAELETKDEVHTISSWHEINGKWYIDGTTRQNNFYIFQFDAQKSNQRSSLRIVSRYQTEYFPTSKPVWQEIDGQWYIAIGSWSAIMVLKYDPKITDQMGGLVVQSEYSTGRVIHSTPRWQQVQDEWYIAVGSDDLHLHLIKFGKKIRRDL